MKLSAALSVVLVALAASAADAQSRSAQSRERAQDIPVSARPPAGMCRIWLDNVPAAQQPAPTDCATAVRNRSVRGRVIFGDDYVKKGRSSDSSRPVKGFAPTQRKP